MSRPVHVVQAQQVLRLLLGLCALALVACDSLWTSFRGPNPEHCIASPGRCSKGLVCNPLTKLCEVPPTMLSLVAGGLGAAGDGVGAEASFNVPSLVVADGVGNVYVSDLGSHTIRKVEARTGIVTTLAGQAGMPGSADGIGATARFNGPLGLALDGAGALFVSEYSNHTIRKVDVSTGAVTTLAGTAGVPGSMDGPGAAARFNNPYGLAVDGAGALYVVDSRNHAIRKVVLSTGAVTTIAGTAGMSGSFDGKGPMAQFKDPAGIAADRAGALYVTDTNNQTVRKVVLSTGDVTTLAGAVGMPGNTDGAGATARFNYPYGIAMDGSGTLYVADYSGHTVRKVMVDTGAVTTLVGKAGIAGSTDGTGTTATFNGPNGLATDGAGTLYSADRNSHTARKIVLATATVSTLAGTAGVQTAIATGGSADGVGGAVRFKNPYGVVAGDADTLYVADTYNHTIRKVDVRTGAVTTLAGAAGAAGTMDGQGAAARFNLPSALTADGSGSLYVTDYGSQTIRKVDLGSGTVTTIAGTMGMAGNADGVGAVARFDRPQGIAADRAGALFVADTGNHTIRRVEVSTGAVTTLAGAAGIAGITDGSGTSARFNNPYGVALDAVGTLYIADYGNHAMRKLTVGPREVTTISGVAGIAGSADGVGTTARFNGPTGIAFDGAGSLYIADSGNRTIRKLNLGDGSVSTVVGTAGAAGVRLGTLPGRLNDARGVTVSPAGQLFIAESAENAILRVQ